MITVSLSAETGLSTVEDFRALVIKSQNGAIIRLSDVANVTLGSQNYDSNVRFDGRDAVYVGIQVAPNANILTVVEDIRRVFPSLEKQLPEGLNGKIVYDSTKFINSSIDEVKYSLLEALIIVTFVPFLRNVAVCFYSCGHDSIVFDRHIFSNAPVWFFYQHLDASCLCPWHWPCGG